MNYELRIKVFALSMIIASLFMIQPAYAQTPTPHPCSTDPNSTIYEDYVAKYGPCPGGLIEIEGVVGNMISAVVGLGLVAMLVLLVMAGFKYLTSGGEPKAISVAHHTVTWALLGMLFLIVAWLILQLIENFTGIKVTVFDIRSLCNVTIAGVIEDICP